MDAWQDGLLDALPSIQCEYQFFEAITRLAHQLGFEYCAYGIRTPFPTSRPRVVTFNNYPGEWWAQYQEKGYLAIDPTVCHGLRSTVPITWTDDLFATTRTLWEDAQSFGLRFGWAQASRDANGTAGMLTLVRSSEPLSESEIRHKEHRLAWLVQTVHLGMSRRLTPKLLPESEVQLTDRERAVLRWTADGKTSGEIADILGISERTVNFHINNAAAKLGAVNKLAAAVRAAALGFLCE